MLLLTWTCSGVDEWRGAACWSREDWGKDLLRAMREDRFKELGRTMDESRDASRPRQLMRLKTRDSLFDLSSSQRMTLPAHFAAGRAQLLVSHGARGASREL